MRKGVLAGVVVLLAIVGGRQVRGAGVLRGSLTFKNYGIEVYASLDGDYQATSGTGENFGAKITTVEADELL